MSAKSTARIAWRNLWRNQRRTALALAAIGLSVALVIVYQSVTRAYGDWILETMTGPLLGHVQVHEPGWRRDRAMDRSIRGVSSIVEEVRSDPGVAGAGARLYAPALAALTEEGFAVVVLGVDWDAETPPMRLLAGIRPPRDTRGVLVGRALAETMGVREGDEIALVGQGADGSLANDLVVVSAVVYTPVDFVNQQGVIMALDSAQSLFAMPDEAHEIVIHGRDPQAVQELATRIRQIPELVSAEVLDWQSLAPELMSLVEIVDLVGVFALILVFLAASAGIANTMLMATFERTHEIGMLLALGTAPGRIVRMILAESVALGAVGTFIGGGLGIAFVLVTGKSGIDFAALTGGGPTELSFAGLAWSLRFFPRLAVTDVVRTVVAVVITSLLASAWPALRAARLQPARALRD